MRVKKVNQILHTIDKLIKFERRVSHRCKMLPEGYVEYKRREFCKDFKCPVQLMLNKQTEGSPEYERTRQKCGAACLYTTWQFHHWLIEKGYLILKPKASSE